MITSIPVGSWTWQVKSGPSGSGTLQRCVRTALAVYDRLASLDCAFGAPEGAAAVRSAGPKKEVLFSRRHVAVVPGAPDGGADVVRLLREAAEAAGNSEGLVSFWLTCPGKWADAGTEITAARLFEVDVAAWSESAGTVTLHTYSDAWLTHNLRGCKQPETHAANAPRLSAVLRGISELTGDEPDPGDPTWYATPTAEGFEALPDEDPELLDSWDMFEVPYRLKKLTEAAASEPEGYADETEGNVHYVTVARGDRILGYLWEADVDAAAGYEPRSAAGEAAFEAGAFWLARLASAKNRGLSPAEAVRELAAVDGAGAGCLLPGSDTDATSLSVLRDLAGRS
ncbi:MULTISPECIES: hypothetical protein [Streptomyces]|uniref:GNAT family N-acetyltransferase n=1 Tax=Streptomyces luteosporeus TaxID=173856 RepID=A0ABN3TP71_9ACTN